MKVIAKQWWSFCKLLTYDCKKTSSCFLFSTFFLLKSFHKLLNNWEKPVCGSCKSDFWCIFTHRIKTKRYQTNFESLIYSVKEIPFGILLLKFLIRIVVSIHDTLEYIWLYSHNWISMQAAIIITLPKMHLIMHHVFSMNNECLICLKILKMKLESLQCNRRYISYGHKFQKWIGRFR